MNLKDTRTEAAEKIRKQQQKKNLTEEQDLKMYDTAVEVMAHFNRVMNSGTENLGHSMK